MDKNNIGYGMECRSVMWQLGKVVNGMAGYDTVVLCTVYCGSTFISHGRVWFIVLYIVVLMGYGLVR